MATTPNLLLPYPGPLDPPDGPGAIYGLATAIDTQAFYADATPAGGITYAGLINDWSGGGAQRTTAVRSGRVGVLNVGCALSGGTANFSVPSINQILQVPPGLRPLHQTAGIMALYSSDGTSWNGYAITEFNTDGTLALKYVSRGSGFMSGSIGYPIAI